MDRDKVKRMATLQTSHNENLVQLEKAETEGFTKEIEYSLKKIVR